VNPFALPSQSILTNLGRRVSNAALAQVQVNATPRSSWTFTGSYGLLHFTDSLNLDSTDSAFSAGYNYQLSPRDVIGVSYAFSAIRFNPQVESINDNSVQIIFGHHISDRLMFQAGIGPDLYSVTPLVGPSNGVQASWAANAGLAYQLSHTTLTAAFSRGVSGGAGILAGSLTNAVVFGVTHQLGRETFLTGTVGFAANKSLPLVAVTSTNYNAVNTALGFSHKLSRSFSVNASYNFTHQGTNAAACSGPGCAGAFLRHQVWIGFSWDINPQPIR
jgi:hypothetical protein